MEINTVIFDLGNVLVKYDWENFLKSFGFEEHTYRAVADAVFLSDVWQWGDAGLSPEEELRLFIEQAPEFEKEIRMVHEKLAGCISKYEYTDHLIAYYREKGFKIYYLSNYSEDLYNKTKEELSFIESFDGGVFSYEEKCIKPDEKLYQILLERYEIIPETALFLDDREENIEAAKWLGIQGKVFTEDFLNKILGEKGDEYTYE